MNRAGVIKPASPHPPKPHSLAPPMWVIAATVGSSIMGITLLTPALPLVQGDLGASSAAVQLLLTVYLAAIAIGQLIYGTLSDRYGRRPILLFGAFLYGVGGAFGTVADTIELLTTYRIVQGLGAAACLSMGRAMVNDCFERAVAAKHMATIQIMQALVPVLSLAFGGVLAQYAGWQGAMSMTSLAGFIVFLLAIFKTRETNQERATTIDLKSITEAYATVLGNPVFLSFALASGLQVGMFFAMNGFMPYQYERHGLTPLEFGFWFSLTSVFYLFGNTANRLYFVSRGIERAAMIGCSLSLLSVIALFITQLIGMTHPLSLALPCCLFGFSNGIVIANSTIGAISAAGSNAGTGTGITGAWQMAAGGIFGSIIVSLGGAQNFLIGATGMIIMSLGSVLSIAVVYRIRKTLSG